MSWRANIKNRIDQISSLDINVVNEFPTKDNFSKNNYRKCWVTALFIDISGYTKICQEKDDKYVGKLIQTFHEGVLSIMNQYGLKHIQIQGDGIFGVLGTPLKNDVNDQNIFDCAMDIKGYLSIYWKLAKYKISIATKEELMIVVGNDEEREVVFAGGAVNEAKKLMEKATMDNVILFNNSFVINNDKNLWNTKDNCSYIVGKNNGINYSSYYKLGWE